MIGQGYYGTITPPVIQRNVFGGTHLILHIKQRYLKVDWRQNNYWIANSNASLLDGKYSYNASKKNTFLVDSEVFPQTLKVLLTRAKPLGIKIKLLDWHTIASLEDFEDAFLDYWFNYQIIKEDFVIQVHFFIAEVQRYEDCSSRSFMSSSYETCR